MSVCLAEIGIVIDDRFLLFCRFQQFQYLVAKHRVKGVIRTDYYYIVFMDFRKQDVEPLFGVVFIKNVFRITVLIQECE